MDIVDQVGGEVNLCLAEKECWGSRMESRDFHGGRGDVKKLYINAGQELVKGRTGYWPTTVAKCLTKLQLGLIASLCLLNCFSLLCGTF